MKVARYSTHMPALYIIATPIGNLGDITVRAKEVLSGVSAIICEDTRVTGGLLHILELPKKELLERLKEVA